jgi:hypothetical protein
MVGFQMLSCKEPFYPENVKGNPGFLVVDGFINAGNDSSFIRLTRTASLNDSSVITELRATVYVSDSFGGIFPLVESGNGYYAAGQLNLSQNRTYKLNIQTSDGRKYASDSFPVMTSPTIDSLSWVEDSVGVSVYAYSHDPNNQAKYYRWDYIETWRYDDGVAAILYWDTALSMVLPRPPSDQIYSCWATNKSTNLILATTQNLRTDTINHQLVCEVPAGSEKMSVRYSILVNQYSLTKEAYEYWQNLKTNTELTGSLFDPMPSQITGNLHCVSKPSEVVLGYVGASTVSNKRIFINRRDLTWFYRPYWIGCDGGFRIIIDPNDPARLSKIYNYVLAPDHLYTIVDLLASGAIILAPNYCADCREHGGTNQTPSFW